MNLLIQLIFLIVITGFIVFLINQVPMPQWARNIVNGLAALLVVLWVLGAMGFVPQHYLHYR